MSAATAPAQRYRKALLGLLAAVPLAGLLLAVNGLAQSGRNQARDLQPEAEFHMARAIYADGTGGYVGGSRSFRGLRRPGMWAIDYPEAESHFIGGIRRLSRIDAADDSVHLQLTDDALFDYPWLFLQQPGYWIAREDEIPRLREYLLRGGFLVIDDFHGEGEWQNLSRILNRVFPDKPIVDLDPSHDIFHALYDLDQLTQIPGERHLRWGGRGGQAYMEGPQKWAGIYDDAGRLMVAINFNMDMGDAWEHADDPFYPEPMTALAYRFGLNYLIYAMTH